MFVVIIALDSSPSQAGLGHRGKCRPHTAPQNYCKVVVARPLAKIGVRKAAIIIIITYYYDIVIKKGENFFRNETVRSPVEEFILFKFLNFKIVHDTKERNSSNYFIIARTKRFKNSIFFETLFFF